MSLGPIPTRKNEAAIKDAGEGYFNLLIRAWTKIANPRRQVLLQILATKQIAQVEKIVAKMPQEEVERLCVQFEPIKGDNGKGEIPKDDPITSAPNEKAETDGQTAANPSS